MASYGDIGECNWPPYSNTPYDHNNSYQYYPISYSSYEIWNPNPNSTQSCPNYYNYHDYYAAQQPEINYSVYNPSEPKLCAFSETKYIVSYSTIAHDDTEFYEYDPDPYDGGYDIAQTYGKSLPPSDQICYPISTRESNGPDPVGFSYGSIPSPYGKDNDQPVKPSNKTEQIVDKERDIVTSDVEKVEDFNSLRDPEKENGYGYQVAYSPYGFGLESVDICDGIFGYWPCWEKYQKGNVNCQVSDQEISHPWKSTADYLFGSPFGYGGDQSRDERFGDFGYGSYYQQEHQHLEDW